MKRIASLIFLFLLILNMTITAPSLAMDNITLIYKESTGAIYEDIPYFIEEKGDLMHINADFKDEYQQIVTDKNLNTTKLETGFPENTNIITIYRKAARLVIKGKQNI